MARPETITDVELTRRLARVFRHNGYEGASLSRLAGEAQLTKAALYHRYPGGKEDMALAVLRQADEEMDNGVALALAASGDPRQRLAGMARTIEDFYEGGARCCLIDLFSVEGTPDKVRAPLAQGVRDWIMSIAALLAEAGMDDAEAAARAEDAIVSIEGALVVSRALGDSGPFLRVVRNLPEALLRR